MKYIASISYDGSLFYGFQRLNDKRTVQHVIENHISKTLNEDIKIKGSSRTDRFVHAVDQRIAFEISHEISIKNIEIMFEKMPKDIRLNWVKSDFNKHIRYDVKEKEYIYKIKRDFSIFEQSHFLFSENIDIKKMKTAAKALSGKNDYQSFTYDQKDTIRDVKLTIMKKSNNEIWIKFISKGFKRYMCRMLASAIIDFSSGKLTIKNIEKLIEYPEFNSYGKKVPGSALYLNKITYK